MMHIGEHFRCFLSLKIKSLPIPLNSTALKKMNEGKTSLVRELMYFNTFNVKTCKVDLIPVFSPVALWLMGEI